jgi:hypothetical protein
MYRRIHSELSGREPRCSEVPGCRRLMVVGHLCGCSCPSHPHSLRTSHVNFLTPSVIHVLSCTTRQAACRCDAQAMQAMHCAVSGHATRNNARHVNQRGCDCVSGRTACWFLKTLRALFSIEHTEHYLNIFIFVFGLPLPQFDFDFRRSPVCV